MTTRPAEPEDAEAIRTVARRSWERDYPDTVSRETITDTVGEWYASDTVESATADAGTVLLVAESDDEVVGFSHAAISTGSSAGSILRLYVLPDRRGEGLGSALLSDTIEHLQDRDCDRIEAMVLAENDAGNGFYLGAGFERVGTEETSVGDERHEEHRYVYRND
jgi:ribosomal protein S18 acetylase RimI-like enzyme